MHFPIHYPLCSYHWCCSPFLQWGRRWQWRFCWWCRTGFLDSFGSGKERYRIQGREATRSSLAQPADTYPRGGRREERGGRRGGSWGQTRSIIIAVIFCYSITLNVYLSFSLFSLILPFSRSVFTHTIVLLSLCMNLQTYICTLSLHYALMNNARAHLFLWAGLIIGCSFSSTHFVLQQKEFLVDPR